MDITANDVESVTFTTSKRGYDQEQVDRFLDNVAATLRANEEKLRQLQARVSELETQSAEQRETEEMMRRTLLVAQRASDEALAEAQAQAREMIARAEAQAREAEAQAQARVNEMETHYTRQRQAIEADIEALRRFHADFRQQLQQMITEHADILHRTGRLSESEPAALPTGSPAPPAQAAVTPGAGVGATSGAGATSFGTDAPGEASRPRATAAMTPPPGSGPVPSEPRQPAPGGQMTSGGQIRIPAPDESGPMQAAAADSSGPDASPAEAVEAPPPPPQVARPTSVGDFGGDPTAPPPAPPKHEAPPRPATAPPAPDEGSVS